MDFRSRRRFARARSLRILALVPLLGSCAGPVSVSGVLVPTGPSREGHLDQAVVYVESGRRTLDRRFPARADRVPLTFEHGSLGPAVSVAKVDSWLEIWNADTLFHQPFSRSPAATFDGRTVRPNAGTAVRLNAAGPVQIFCQLHEWESAELLVLENGAWTRPDTTGAFLFPPLPRGRYVIRAWHPRLGEQNVPLDVKRSGPMSVELHY